MVRDGVGCGGDLAGGDAGDAHGDVGGTGDEIEHVEFCPRPYDEP